MITVPDPQDNKNPNLDRDNSIGSNDSDGVASKVVSSDRSSSAK